MAVWQEEYELYRKYLHNITKFYSRDVHTKAYFELTLSLVAIIVFAVFAIKPTVVTIGEKYREMNDKQQIVAKLESKVDSLSKAQTLLEEQGEVIAQLDEAIPDQSSPEEYIIQVDGLTTVNSTTLDGMFIENTPLSGVGVLSDAEALTDNSVQTSSSLAVSWFPFSLTVVGEYNNLKNYLTSLENLRRPIRLKSSGIETIEGVGLKLILEGDVPYKMP